MPTILIIVAAFIGVAALVGAVASLFVSGASESIEDRLEVLAGMKTAGQIQAKQKEQSLLAGPLDDVPGLLEGFFSRMLNVRLLLDQAAMTISPPQFIMLCFGFAGLGSLAVAFAPVSILFAPLAACLGFLPLLYAVFMRKRRMKKFAKQLPKLLN